MAKLRRSRGCTPACELAGTVGSHPRIAPPCFDAAVFALLDRTSKLRSSRPQLVDCRIDVVAHQRDRVVTRVVVGLAFPFAVSRVHAQLARPRFENEPIVIEILGDVLPPKDIT